MNVVGYQAVKVVSSSFGEAMEKDLNGNINVLLVWFWGEGHAGSYLADSTIVASLDTELNTVTMISIPRDLYINYQGKFAFKINSLYAWAYNHVDVPEWFDEELAHEYRMGEAATVLAEKTSDITGLEIPYYALIDFSWFEELIDTLGGIDIDIPYAIHDSQYPGPNNTYQTFSIAAGPQVLDGETALKYARSRKTTSDFSRSKRQQMIIKAILEKLKNTENLTSVGTVKDLYAQFDEIVTTNVTVRNILAMIDHAYYMPEVFTFGYTTECSNGVWRTMKPGCMLYFPSRDAFDGLATMLPYGATPSKVSVYENTAYFAYIVAHKWGFLLENPSIQILNSIDPDYARQYVYRDGLASKTAVKLRRFGLDIQDVDNSDRNIEKTTVTIYGTGSYNNTIETLQLFIPIDEDNIIINSEEESTYNMVVELGSDYIDKVGDTPFNYYK